MSVVVCRSQPDPWYQVSADLNQSHCVNTQSSAEEDPLVDFLLPLIFLTLPPPVGLPGQTVRSDSLQRSLVYPSSLSEARVYVSSVDINIGYIKLESRAVWVGGIFTADTSEALPSGCKHGQQRIQMDHFPLASLTRNSRRGLLLYS